MSNLVSENPIAQPPARWWHKPITILANLLGIGVAISGGIVLFVWLIFGDMDRVTLTVKNETALPIDSVQIVDEKGVVLLNLGPIAPAAEAKSSVHFGNDEGEADLILKQSGRSSSREMAVLLNDNGPFEYHATVRATGIHVNYDICSKGGGSYDFASPTTMP